MARRFANRWTRVALTAVACCTATPAWACPTCNSALEGDPAALAFYWSTLFMIAMPYLLVCVVGGGVALIYWNAARKAPALTEQIERLWSAGGPEKEGGR